MRLHVIPMMVNDTDAAHLIGSYRQPLRKLGYPQLWAQLSIGCNGLAEHGAVLGPGLNVQVFRDGTTPAVTLLKASTDFQLAFMITYLERSDIRACGESMRSMRRVSEISGSRPRLAHPVIATARGNQA